MFRKLQRRLGAGAFLLAAALATSPAYSKLIMSEQAALERAFPGVNAEKKSITLTPEQIAEVEKMAGGKVPAADIVVFDAPGQGRAYLETHKVRTLPETVMSVVGPDGRLKAAYILQFNEHTDYLLPERWLKTLEGKPLDPNLMPDKGVKVVSGSTLSVQVLTASVRRALAIDAVYFGKK